MYCNDALKLIKKAREEGNSLAAAMCEYAESSVLAEKCGQNAKNVLARFAPKRIIDMRENYCLQLMKG